MDRVDEVEAEDYMSTVTTSEGSTIKKNYLEFEYSYGYDCKNIFNICVADEDHIIYPSGNIIHILNAKTRELKFRRSLGGRGIGHIMKNPTKSHIAVGEKGTGGKVIIHMWPSWKMLHTLKTDGSDDVTRLAYSPDGTLLCTHGGAPDFTLTIWNWVKPEKIFERKGCSKNILNCMFSTYVPGQYVFSGSEYIQFWKLTSTYTGRKLKDQLGRFGKTQSSDIIGFLPMPDEKVVSGNSCGNILVWKDGLISLEVSRKNNNPCHKGPITQFELKEGELATVGMDGIVKYWYYKIIDQADFLDDHPLLEIEAMYEFRVGYPKQPAQLMGMRKQNPEDPDDGYWFAQDANGGIWKLELDLNIDFPYHEQLLTCHAGPVMDIAVSPQGSYLCSLGWDGRIYVYNYVQRELLIQKQVAGNGCRILWLPVQWKACVLLTAYANGVLRLHALNMESITLLQAIKPHSKPITFLTLSPEKNLVLTGSEDKTIFINVMIRTNQRIHLDPVGYVEIQAPVSFASWNPTMSTKVLISSKEGHLIEVEVPEEPSHQDVESYELKNIKQEIILLKHVKTNRTLLGVVHLTRNETPNETNSVNEDSFEDDPASVLFATYTDKGTILLSLGGSKSGHLYEYKFGEDTLSCSAVPNATDIEINTCAYYNNRNYLALGMKDGEVRVVRVNPRNACDTTDYLALFMHDISNGKMNRICFTSDYRFMFSCGEDGNIFSYRVTSENDDYSEIVETPLPKIQEIFDDVQDIQEDELTLEETKRKLKHIRETNATTERTIMVENTISSLEKRFLELTKRNMELPVIQRFLPEELEIDSRITASIKKVFENEMDTLKLEMEYKVNKCEIALKKIYDYFIKELESPTISILAVDKPWQVSTFRHRLLPPDYSEVKQDVVKRIKKTENEETDWNLDEYRIEEAEIVKKSISTIDKKFRESDASLTELNVSSDEFKEEVKLKRMMSNYLARRTRAETEQAKWTEIVNNKPDPELNDKFDDAAIEEAGKNLGDYKLKSEETFCVPKSMQSNVVKKYKEILDARERIYRANSEFNKQVYSLRRAKFQLIEKIKSYHNRIELFSKKYDCEDLWGKVRVPHDIPNISREKEMADVEFKIPPKEELLLKCSELQEKNMQIEEFHEGSEDRRTRLEDPRGPTPEILSNREVEEEEDKSVKVVSSTRLNALKDEDKIETRWEKEIRNFNVLFYTDRHEQICQLIERKIEKFDIAVKNLSDSRKVVAIKTTYLHLHLLKLNMELIILKKCEDDEDKLNSKLSKSLKEVQEQHKKVKEFEVKIGVVNAEVAALSKENVNLIDNFNKSIVESKFCRVLRKNFKRKYKPPVQKISEDSEDASPAEESEDSEDESLSTSSSDEDAGTKIDLRVCPEGCEVELYNFTLTQRAQRHKYELKIEELKIQEGALERNLEKSINKMTDLLEVLQKTQNELEDFQRFKQRQLNDTDVLIVTRMSCIAGSSISNLRTMLLFSKKVLERLSEREKELINEMEGHRNNHRKLHQHLVRMRQDCNYMRNIIQSLNDEIKECQMKKFGDEITVQELEESVLKRLLAKVRSPEESYRKEQERKYDRLKKNIHTRREVLNQAIRDHTEKLNTALTLEKEKTFLTSQIQKQQGVKKFSIKESPYKEENKKLHDIVQKQTIQIKSLKAEMKALSHKSRNFPTTPGMSGFPLSEDDDMSAQVHVSLKEMQRKVKRVRTRSAVTAEKETNDTLLQALIEEVLQNLPETVDNDHQVAEEQTATERLKQLMDDLMIADGQSRAQQMVSEVIDVLPVKSREEILQMISATEKEKYGTEEGASTDVMTALRDVVVKLLDNSVELKAILTDIINDAPFLEEEYELDVERIFDATVDEFGNVFSSATLWRSKVEEVLKSQPKQVLDALNVREVGKEIIKTIMLAKMATVVDELKHLKRGKRVEKKKPKTVSLVTSPEDKGELQGNKEEVQETDDNTVEAEEQQEEGKSLGDNLEANVDCKESHADDQT